MSSWPNASCWRASSPASGARHAAAAKSPVTDGRRSRTRRSGANMDRTPKRGGAVSPVIPEPVTPSVVMRVLFPVPGRSPGCRGRGGVALPGHRSIPDRGRPASATDLVGELGDAVGDGRPVRGLGDALVESGEHARVAGGPATDVHAQVDRD